MTARPSDSLIDWVQRIPVPQPWQEGEHIPWDEPGFSRRMLREHLSQEHDAASRREERIERQVAWIHNQALAGKPSRVLDLGCGPGLYSARLARLGHTCQGIDFSPASIEYARQVADRDGLDCRYSLADLRQVDFGAGYDLAMLIYGEFNIFPPAEASRLLAKACRALVPGGILLLEPHTYLGVRRRGALPATWFTAAAGLFSDQPHLVLQENFWDAASQTATTRYACVDAPTGRVERFAESLQAYPQTRLRQMLLDQGFTSTGAYPSLTGEEVSDNPDLYVLLARKG